MSSPRYDSDVMPLEQVSLLLLRWEEESASGNVTEILNELAKLFEIETEAFLKKDPDPFDDRHPSRLLPDCTLGHMLKVIFRNERIVDAIVKSYCTTDNLELNTAACRLLLDILPGLESVIFEEEGFVPQLLNWVENAPNPLRSYATGLVAAAMDVAEIAANFRDRNAYFVPLMLKRLHHVSEKYLKSPSSSDFGNINRPFAEFGKKHVLPLEDESKSNHRSPRKRKKNNSDAVRNLRYSPVLPEVKSGTADSNDQIPTVTTAFDESSNNKWNGLVIGSYQVFPLTLAAEQRYILQYLTPLGEYQELIGHVLESNVLYLILRYIDIRQNPDVRLSFEALKYLASLLVHKKVAIEFLSIGGLKLLLKVPYPSIAATGVSICLYYFSYTEEVMEKICAMPSLDIAELVRYALWLLECSHDSSRCHATMFFGFAFAFKIILHHFDEQDGLRKLFNVMSTLDIFASRNNRSLSDDQVFANRQTTRHVCGALKRYFEAHLASEIEGISSSGCDIPSRQNKHKAMNLSYKSIEGYLNTWREAVGPMVPWKPNDEFLQLDGVPFLIELISDYFSTSYSGRAETVRNAMDILKICSLIGRTQQIFCEKPNTPEYSSGPNGMTVLLAAAEGELLPVAEVQKSALEIIINCVCTKIEGENDRNFTVSKYTRRVRTVEELLSKLCENVRIKNGIMTLINLLSCKTPLTDADAIRALACKALCGLARSSHVKQVIGKLPIITDGELLHLMKEPVLQDKGQDHVLFCKYGLELIEKVTGSPVCAGSESSLLNINKSEIVAKTQIVYNEAQLLQLICEHLVSKGFSETASCLQKEMKERGIVTLPSCTYSSSTPRTPRSAFKRSTVVVNSTTPSSTHNSSSSVPSTPIPPPSVPLRIVVTKKTPMQEYKSPSRLQKSQACLGNFYQTPAMKRQLTNFSQAPVISLNSIITEYLRKQHGLCKTPMLACPPFDLFNPHKCPEPQNRRNAPTNFVLRFQNKQTLTHGGVGGAALDRKIIYNKFRFVRAFRDTEGRDDFSCCSFFNFSSSKCLHTRVLVGTDGQLGSTLGELKVFNLNTAEEEMSKNSHFRGLNYIESSKLAPLIITSDGGRIGNSSLWKLDDDLEIVRQYSEVSHLEFGKKTVQKAVGTKHDSAVLIDNTNGTELCKFITRDLGNAYPSNQATFDYTDELVLTDGIIFDCRSGEIVHKLDKFNSIMNGVFHPNGREIISNTEIWDIRTYKLLRSVANLEYSRPTFNPTGDIIYGVFCNKDAPDERINTFNTLDSHDYSSIATVDLKRPVFELSADVNDRYVATIESQSFIPTDPYNPPLRGLDSVCRLYEIGRSKEDGDEDNEESDDTEEETDDDDEVDDVEMDGDMEGREDDDIVFEIDDNQQDSSSDGSDESETLFSLSNSLED